MKFIELAKERYSVRSYLPNKIEHEKLQLILEAGRVAPTACNNQPQRILVIQSEEGLEKIGQTAPLKCFMLLAFSLCAQIEPKLGYDQWMK